MKKIFLLLFLSLILLTGTANALSGIGAAGYIVIEEQTGAVLAEHNADEPMFPASTTKILTVLLAVEHGDLDAVVEVGPEINRVPANGSKVRLQVGDKITLRDLLWGTMVRSGNDAAYTIAVHIARTVSSQDLTTQQAVEYFALMMNEKAWEVGAANSNFVCPDGYHHPEHYSTARDLALITREAMRVDFIREMAGTREYTATYSRGGKEVTATWRNTNRLLHPGTEFYEPRSTGFKTGFTGMAGHCLVSTAASDDLTVVAVVLGGSSNERWEDSRTLLNYGLDNYLFYRVSEPGELVTVVSLTNQGRKEQDTLTVTSSLGLWQLLNKADVENIQPRIIWDETKLATAQEIVLKAPIKEGEQVGWVEYWLHEELLIRSPLVAEVGVNAKSWWERNLFWLFSSAIALMTWVLYTLAMAVRHQGVRNNGPTLMVYKTSPWSRGRTGE